MKFEIWSRFSGTVFNQPTVCRTIATMKKVRVQFEIRRMILFSYMLSLSNTPATSSRQTHLNIQFFYKARIEFNSDRPSLA